MNCLPLVAKILTAGCRKVISYEAPLPCGPKIFCSSHPSTIDPLYAYEVMERPAILVMRWGFEVPLVGAVLRSGDCIPVDGRNGHAAYCAALNALLSGRSVYFCPEGKFSDGTYQTAKTGATRLAIQTQLPLVPIGIRHEGKVVRFHIQGCRVQWMPFGTTHINIGRAMHFAKPSFKFPDWPAISTGLVMGKIKDLSL